jgi:hypothetical protein
MMQTMRTTITLDADTEALVKRAMNERGLTFKEAVNEAIRAGLGGRTSAKPFSTPTFAMGADPRINLDKALRLAGDLENEEIVHEMSARK